MRSLFSLVLIALAMPAFADMPKDMPKRKPGLWEIRMQSDQMPKPMVSQQCIDEKTDSSMQQWGEQKGKEHCSNTSVRKEGNRIITESVCKIGGTTATTKGVFSGDFSSNYRGDIESSYNPPMMGMKQSKQSLEAKWLGACKPGQKPGDVIMPGMGNMNLNELMKQAPKR